MRVPRYQKTIDRFQNNYVTCFLTGGNIRFLLLLQSPPTSLPSSSSGTASSRMSTSIAANRTSQATEEAIRQFMVDVYEVWVKTIMNPFYRVNMEVKSPVFRQRVAAAARKYL